MLTTAAVILILTIKVAVGQDHRVTVNILPLDMALNSSDDIYFGCAANMSKLLETKYLNKERNESSNFGIAWQEAVKKQRHKPENNLSINHLLAIYVYTGGLVYNDFNRNCRTGRQNYTDNTYKWYSLQFLLTEAIQILKETQQRCRITYRGTKLTFDENVLNKQVRFGSFASSSLDRNRTKFFGNESCFEISTCEGADVSKYAKLPREKEVLIPPYETFIVTGIENNTWCKTVFSLKSSGIKSVLNCAVTHPV